MIQAGTVRFRDQDSKSEAFAIVHYSNDSVAVGLSIEINRDIEVLMTKAEARQLLELLQQARR
jgi:hypothetical protein